MATLKALRAAWDKPFLADPDDTAATQARGMLTRQLAAAILAAPLTTRCKPTPVGDMFLTGVSWSREAGDRARRVADPATNPVAYHAALGTPHTAELTADGTMAGTTWCRCGGGARADGMVRYERWTAEGCVAHGYVCKSCRGIAQAG